MCVCLSAAVLYCTLLAQAQSATEKEKLEEKMSSEPELLKILRALKETDKEDIVQEERARRQAARQSRVDANLEDMPVEGEHARVSESRGRVFGVVVMQACALCDRVFVSRFSQQTALHVHLLPIICPVKLINAARV